MSDNTKNLLYLLPDVAYVVELIEGKDEYTYTVKDYLQVNGKFMNENELLEESIKKLVTKIDKKDYDLVLPDFLFTNTIVNVEETGDAKVAEKLEEKIIPDLGISGRTHAIQHFVLSELKGVSKVQLSALEFSVLDPFKNAFGKESVASIKKVHPLSWTVKSLISLEPSISLVQLGSNVFLAQQYIGVDQASFAEVADVEKLAETIKTLKGAEPSIQSLYLLSNELVEEKLKKALSDTLPIQQLAQPDEDSEMPTYVRQIIEAGARTLVVPDFKLPEFSLDAQPDENAPVPAVTNSEQETDPPAKEKEEEKEAPKEPAEAKEEKPAEEATKVVPPVELPTPTEIGVEGEGDDMKEAEKETAVSQTDLKEDSQPEDSSPKSEPEAEKPAEPEKAPDKDEEAEPKEDKKPEVDLAQFSAHEEEEKESEDKAEAKKEEKKSVQPEEKDMSEKTVTAEPEKPKKEVIKNDSGVNSMMRMIFVGLVSFFITVGVGLGLGLGFLNFTNQGESAPTEEVAEVSPSPAPTAEPTKAPEIDRASYEVLVVNATTQAGYAGSVAGDLEEAGFEGVAAGNAKGEYEEGYYVLLEEEDANLLATLEKDTGLTLSFSAEKQVEDTSEEYDIVIVLGATE